MTSKKSQSGTKSKKEYDVFLSYARADEPFVVRLNAALESKNVSVWFDLVEIQAGDNVRARLQEGLKQSQNCVVVVSPDAIESRWVTAESFLAQGLAEGKFESRRIIPITLRDADSRELLSDRKPVDFRNESAFDNSVDELITAISGKPKKLISKPPAKSKETKMKPKRLTPGELLRKLYTIQGLKDDLRDENVFQDFDIQRPGHNINPVYFLWADVYRGCQIKAYTNKHYLRVLFTNQRASYPGSIAVRPKDEKPLKNSHRKGFLSFEVRIPRQALQNRKLLREVGIAIRVVNGWVQHWEYAVHPRDGRLEFKVDSAMWTKCSVDLNDQSKWCLFHSDGNHLFGPEKADFKIISTVVFELGRPGQLISSKRDRGIIDIRNISLSDT